MADDVFTVKGPRNEPDPKKQDDYQARLLKLIPGETVSLYAVTTGLINSQFPTSPNRFPYLATITVGCLVLTFVIRAFESRDKSDQEHGWRNVQWGNVAVACFSFLIYAYTLGGPFQAFPYRWPSWSEGWSPVFGTIASGFWTILLPYLYRAARI